MYNVCVANSSVLDDDGSERAEGAGGGDPCPR